MIGLGLDLDLDLDLHRCLDKAATRRSAAAAPGKPEKHLYTVTQVSSSCSRLPCTYSILNSNPNGDLLAKHS